MIMAKILKRVGRILGFGRAAVLRPELVRVEP